MADHGSLADVLERAADGASVRTLVASTLGGLIALLAIVFWGLFGGHGRWLLPFAGGAVATLAFGLGGLAHQRLRDELAQTVLDRPRVRALRALQALSVLAGATGAIVLAGHVFIALYGKPFFN